MERTLSLGAFTELNENEVMEVEGGNPLYIGLGLVAVIWCVLELTVINQVNEGNKKMAQVNANTSGEPYTVKLIGIGGAIQGGSYTAIPAE